jgi:hypothetical protein
MVHTSFSSKASIEAVKRNPILCNSWNKEHKLIKKEPPGGMRSDKTQRTV